VRIHGDFSDFRRLWAGQTVSVLGTQVTYLALPLVAINVLAATTFQVGLIETAAFAPFLLVGLPAGAWVDRMRRRPVMIATDLARGALLATIPLAAALHALTLLQIYAVALLTGVATVFFDIAYQSYLPALVGRDGLVEGNAKLQASESIAQVGGPSLAGFLIQAITGALAILVDAGSYVVSAASIASIRKPEPRVIRTGPADLRREIA
jgi:MFS family permease